MLWHFKHVLLIEDKCQDSVVPTAYWWDMEKCWKLLLLNAGMFFFGCEQIPAMKEYSFSFPFQIRTTSWLSSRILLNDYTNLIWFFPPFAQLFFNLVVKSRALVLTWLCRFCNIWKNKSKCFCCLQIEKKVVSSVITSHFEKELVN